MEIEGTTNSATESPVRVCNCRYSKCLKLYCECFSSGDYCQNCNCNNCCNNSENEVKEIQEIRSNKIKLILLRDPFAFRAKIPRNADVFKIEPAPHFKGCNCKRTKCMKKYCECFNAGINCTSSCKCTNCKNDSKVREVKKKYEPPIQEYFEFLIKPLGKRKEFEEDDRSEESSTLCDENSVKSNEILSYEKFEEIFYIRLISLLRDI